MISRPESGEYGSFYEDYIRQVEDEDQIISTLVQQGQTVFKLIQKLSPEQAAHRYAENKWTVQQVIGHLIDTERIMSYRALCFSRGEAKSLPGYDHDAYVEEACFENRHLQNLATEYDALRNATISMFNGFNEEQLLRRGTANDAPFSVRAIAYIIAGHERLHLNSLEQKYGLDIG